VCWAIHPLIDNLIRRALANGHILTPLSTEPCCPNPAAGIAISDANVCHGVSLHLHLVVALGRYVEKRVERHWPKPMLLANRVYAIQYCLLVCMVLATICARRYIGCTHD
jgi:hypothetical protein